MKKKLYEWIYLLFLDFDRDNVILFIIYLVFYFLLK